MLFRSASTGDIIFYLAIDDMLYDNKVIADVVTYFENNDCQIATGIRQLMQPNGSMTDTFLPTPEERKYLQTKNTKYIYNTLISANYIAGACTPFTKKLYEEYGFPTGYTHLEDYPRYLTLLSKGVLIHFIDRPLIIYRLGGITSNYQLTPALAQDFEKVNQDFHYSY